MANDSGSKILKNTHAPPPPPVSYPSEARLSLSLIPGLSSESGLSGVLLGETQFFPCVNADVSSGNEVTSYVAPFRPQS